MIGVEGVAQTERVGRDTGSDRERSGRSELEVLRRDDEEQDPSVCRPERQVDDERVHDLVELEYGPVDLARADPDAPHLVFDWVPDGDVDIIDESVARLIAEVTGSVEGAVCAHAGGPPVCWCRPPLPGLALTFARAHDVDTARSTLVGSGPSHRTLANALGARYVAV